MLPGRLIPGLYKEACSIFSNKVELARFLLMIIVNAEEYCHARRRSANHIKLVVWGFYHLEQHCKRLPNSICPKLFGWNTLLDLNTSIRLPSTLEAIH